MYPNLSFLIIILFSLNIIIKCDNEKEIKYIINAFYNGTPGFYNLNNVELNRKYLLFSFDYETHRKYTNKNNALFRMDSPYEIINNIEYDFIDKEWYNLKMEKDLNNNKNWKKVNIISKLKINDYVYYFEIKDEIDKRKTLIIKVPINNERYDILMIENIFEIPNDHLH